MNDAPPAASRRVVASAAVQERSLAEQWDCVRRSPGNFFEDRLQHSPPFFKRLNQSGSLALECSRAPCHLHCLRSGGSSTPVTT